MGNTTEHHDQTPSPAGSAAPLRRVLLIVACLGLGLCAFLGSDLVRRHLKSSAQTPQTVEPDDATTFLELAEAGSASDAPGAPEQGTVQPAMPVIGQTTSQTTAFEESAADGSVDSQLPENFDERLQQADELVLEGNIRAALTRYEPLLSKASADQEAEIRFRMGLCEEALGNLRQAHQEYGRVIALPAPPRLMELAILGRARAWRLTDRRDLAIGLLFRSLIENETSHDGMPAASLAHLLAALLATRVGPDAGMREPLDDQHLLVPQITARPEQILEEFLQEPARPRTSASSLEELVISRQFSSSPEEIFLNVRSERLPVLDLVRRVTRLTGWSVRLTEEARSRLLEQTLRPQVTELPMSLMLDAILEPLDLVWRTEEKTILIARSFQFSSADLIKHQHSAAERFLRYACVVAPEHPWAAASYLEMGRLAFANGRRESASGNLQQALDQFPRSEFQAIGWLNLGKLLMTAGRIDDALPAFQRAVDHLAGHPWEPVAYLYMGRIHLESNRPREASTALTRALALAEDGPYEDQAALTLASACYLMGHYRRANDVLLNHRVALQRKRSRDPAAFLSCLARYQAATDERERLRSGGTLIAALTNLDPGKAFGGHWWYLAGIACRSVGMVSEELTLFKKCLETSYPFPLQNRMRQILLEDSPAQAVGRLVEIAAPPDAAHDQQVRYQARLTEASLLLRDSNHQAALEICRDILAQDNVPDSSRREALRLMGRTYLERGEFDLAANCFTGLIPKETNREQPPISRSAAGVLP